MRAPPLSRGISSRKNRRTRFVKARFDYDVGVVVYYLVYLEAALEGYVVYPSRRVAAVRVSSLRARRPRHTSCVVRPGSVERKCSQEKKKKKGESKIKKRAALVN